MDLKNLDNMAFESLLYDFYGALLTEKQREIMELYHEENYSIVEISSELKVSKQAVYDSLKKSDRLLREYESKLGLLSGLIKTRETVMSIDERIDSLISSLGSSDRESVRESLNEIREMISGLAD